MRAEERLANAGVAFIVNLMQSQTRLAGGRVEANRNRDQSETEVAFPSCSRHVRTSWHRGRTLSRYLFSSALMAAAYSTQPGASRPVLPGAMHPTVVDAPSRRRKHPSL